MIIIILIIIIISLNIIKLPPNFDELSSNVSSRFGLVILFFNTVVILMM